MEVVGALASSLQIVSQCGQVTMTIIKWVESVKSVDIRIDAFIHEVSTLRMTYESLSRSFKDPSILEAARITNRDVGGNLWSQMSRTLHDCEATMNKITNVLRKINASSTFLKPVVKQLRESLHSGELVRLREQVVIFNSSLMLPMQMITLTQQLRQQEMTTAHQLHLNEQLALLHKGIERIERMSKGLSQPKRSESMGGSTVVDDIPDKAWLENMEDYVGSAKKFLNSASVAASTLSSNSIVQNNDERSPADDIRRGSSFVPLTQQKLKSISMYVDDLVPKEAGPDSGTQIPSEVQSETMFQLDPDYDSDAADDDDIDLQLLQALLQNGDSELVRQNYAAAEDNYREALLVSQSNNFGSLVAFSTADIALMLGECLAKQEKYDETIDLLQPLAGTAAPHSDTLRSSGVSNFSSSQVYADMGQMLAANHLLGKVYLSTADYTHAEKCSVLAFKGRKKLLGEHHAKYIESVHLVIEVYKAKGQTARAEAHRIFLKPSGTALPGGGGSGDYTTPSPPSAAEPISIPHGTPPGRPRRPTFSFTSPFKRSEKTDLAPTSVPTGRSANSPHLIADEFIHLSTSPNDTSSSPMGSYGRPTNHQIRKESSISNGSFANIQRWNTDNEMAGHQILHQRTQSSLQKTATLYAHMSESEMEQKFLEISNLCKDGKTSKAVDRGLIIMQHYDPDSAILVHRTAELKDNIKKGKNKGLASSGYGFSPIHFFCSLKHEALQETDILLRLGADSNAIAHKAGYSKADPFVPLSLAVERGHENIVRKLLQHGATWQPELMRSGSRFNADRDSFHPLLQACLKGYTNIVAILLDHKIKMIEDLFPRLSWHGNSLLHEACYRCDLQLVGLLMSFARQRNTFYDPSYSFIGTPSQQDEFGVTPIMHAVDMRDCFDRLRSHKLQHRIACLSLLLGLTTSDNDVRVKETETGEIMIDHQHSLESPNGSTGQGHNKLASSIHVQDKRGNTVYWYVNQDAVTSTNDGSNNDRAQLIAFLDEQSRKSRLIEL